MNLNYTFLELINKLPFKLAFYIFLIVIFLGFKFSNQQANNSKSKLSPGTERGILEGCKEGMKKDTNIRIADDKIEDYCNCVLMKARNRYTENDMKNLYAKKWNREQLLEYYNIINNKECIPLSEYFNYKPDSSIYSVLFVSKPSIMPTALSQQDMFLFGETAELTDEENMFVEKVEFYKLNFDFELWQTIDKNFAFKFLNEYATTAGFEYPSYKYEENSPIGRFCEMQAYKTIDVYGRKVTFVWIAHFYCLKTNVMILYFGCESKKYPNLIAEKFLNSVKLIK